MSRNSKKDSTSPILRTIRCHLNASEDVLSAAVNVFSVSKALPLGGGLKD